MKKSLMFVLLLLSAGVIHNNCHLMAMQEQAGAPDQEHVHGRINPDDFLQQLLMLFMLDHLGDDNIRVVMVNDCENTSLPIVIAKDQVCCYVCERAFDDGERIAVLPCGDTLCCRCADRAICVHHSCPMCHSETHGYRTRPFFFTVKNHRDDTLEMPILKGDGCCTICREEFKDCDDIAVLPCGHAFCPGCIDHALTLKEVCPNCRRVANKYRARKFFK